jgi:cytochrome P450
MSDKDATPEAAPMNPLDPEFLAHPQEPFRALTKQCPVMPMPAGGPVGRGGAAVMGFDLVKYVLRTPEIFSSNMEAINIGNEVPLIPLQIDPPNLAKYRKLLDPMFTRKKMMLLEPDTRALANELIDKFVDAGECEFDSAFAIPLPCTVFLRLLGLPLEDLDLFLELKDGIIRPDTLDPDERDTMVNATGKQIHDYFKIAMAERRKKRSDDLLSDLLDAEIKGKKLTEDEIQGICYLLLIAGLDTVTATLGCMVAYLAQHPEQRQSLVDRPELIPSAIEELLRWESPVGGVARVAAEDVELAGVKIEAGNMVAVNLGSANVDDVAFPNATNVDFERDPNAHYAFGAGPHKCLGSHLARMELRVAVEEFHRRIPDYEIKAGETPVYKPAIREVSYLPLTFL